MGGWVYFWHKKEGIRRRIVARHCTAHWVVESMERPRVCCAAVTPSNRGTGCRWMNQGTLHDVCPIHET